MDMSAQKIVSSSTLIHFAHSQEGVAKSFRHSGLPQKGRLVILLKGKNLEPVLDSISQIYFEQEEESLLVSLKTAISQTIENLPAEMPLNILTAVLSQEYIYFCGWGAVSSYLSRSGKFIQIFSGKENQIGSCSGKIKEQDSFLLVDGAVSPGAQELIIDLFDQPDSMTAAEDLKNNLPNVIGVFIKIDSLKIEEELIEEILPEKRELKEEVIEPPQIPNTPEERTILLKPKKSLLVRFAELLPETNPFEGKAKESPKRRTMVSVGIVLLSLLLISIIFGIGQKKNVLLKSSYQKELSQAQVNYDQAVAQKDINPTQARGLLSQAKTTVNNLLSQNIQDSDLSNLKQKIDQASPQILGIIDETPSVLLDLSLVRQGVKAKEIKSDGTNLAVLDEAGNRIIFSDLDGKNIGVTGGDNIGKLTTFVLENNKFYGKTPDGIVSLTKQGTSNVVIKSDSSWGQIAKIGTYGGNFYLIDTNGVIWHYTSPSSDKTNWLNGQVNLATVQDLAVDGALWVLTDGKIMKFVRGQGQIISPVGLDQELGSPTALYTDENLDSLYVLDPSNKRLVELDKNGIYKKSYVNDQLAFVKDFVVSKEAGKIILLTETKVLELPLK